MYAFETALNKGKIMPIIDTILKKQWLGITFTALSLLPLSGCSGDGPAIEANPQSIAFNTAPLLALGSSANVEAIASSGLAVSYSSATPAVCSVNSNTGVVTGIAAGTCIIAANQSGNTHYAPAPLVTQSFPVIFNPNQTISFATAPILTLGGTASVFATAISGLPVIYSSMTTDVCTVDSSSGLVTDLTTGTCTIAANQAGDVNYNPAFQAIQTLTVSAPSVVTVPSAPTGVAVTTGNSSNTVIVSVGATGSGGSPITSYTVASSPAGITATGSALPLIATCPSTCAGYSFSVVASNAIGDSLPSTFTDVITTYKVVETFYEPDTQPNNSLFIGTFSFNSTKSTVSNLRGLLSEAMTGGSSAYPSDTMTWLSLNNQLSSVPASLGGVDGLLVTTFMLPTTNTFSTNPTFGGTDGWSPGTGFSLYYGFPGTNPGNAYARIFVNSKDPRVPLTQAQIDKLAYADCATGGMMGATCMTGTTVAGYGAVGTMSGYPISQTITKQ